MFSSITVESATSENDASPEDGVRESASGSSDIPRDPPNAPSAAPTSLFPSLAPSSQAFYVAAPAINS